MAKFNVGDVVTGFRTGEHGDYHVFHTGYGPKHNNRTELTHFPTGTSYVIAYDRGYTETWGEFRYAIAKTKQDFLTGRNEYDYIYVSESQLKMVRPRTKINESELAALMI